MRNRLLISIAAITSIALFFATPSLIGRARAANAVRFAAIANPRHAISSPPSDESQIRAVLDAQVAAWNRGDVDSFMQGYWKSPSTLFIGANGVTRGWQAVLDRYHRTYPNRAAMGHLNFSNLEVQEDCPRSALVIGQYHLQREHDNPSGVFTLSFRKFPEGWRIVVDHTTAFATPAVRQANR